MSDDSIDAGIKGNPSTLAVAAFAYAMLVFGVFELGYEPAGTALTYTLLFAGIAELVGGVMNIARGETYLGSVTAFFGSWLLGFYFLAQADASGGALGVYILALVIPAVMFWIPTFSNRDPVGNGAYATVVVALLFAGAGNLLSMTALHLVAGASSIAASAFLYYMATDVLLDEVAMETTEE